jgi:histidine triad (HIT) family protein
MSDSIFDKIIRREIPADIVFESDEIIAFRDISPQAPVHVLFVPKRKFATLNDVPESEALLLGKLLLAAQAYAKSMRTPTMLDTLRQGTPYAFFA